LDGFVQVGNSVFSLPITEVQFIDKSSLFVLLLGFIRQAETEADSSMTRPEKS
jgi:TRAP-type mannitol/chloroaromatic compound transport system permease large subunit